MVLLYLHSEENAILSIQKIRKYKGELFMNNIPYICGVTFAPFAPAGSFSQERARQSLRTMKENTNVAFLLDTVRV